MVQCERQEAEILQQVAPHGQRVWGRIGKPLIWGATGIGLTENKNCEGHIERNSGPKRLHRETGPLEHLCREGLQIGEPSRAQGDGLLSLEAE
jgi:hypothetical protein